MKSNTFEHNGFSYSFSENQKAREIDFKIESGKECPDFLYKYYSLNENSINSLLDNYLFSAHPYLLNDKHDCSGDLIDYSKLNIRQFIDFLVHEAKMLDIKDVVSLYRTQHQWKLEREVANIEQLRLFRKFGIISMTTKDNDILMWAYYSQNSGFVVKFKVDELPKTFYGAFPINYSDEYKKIDYSSYGSKLSIMYQTNVKSEIWKNENEWRYLTFNGDGNYHPYYEPSDIKSRFFKYSTKSVQEIILGYNFFDLKDYSELDEEYDMIKLVSLKQGDTSELKIKLLNHLATYKIPCKRIYKNNMKYKLEPRQIDIEQIEENKYKIKG